MHALFAPALGVIWSNEIHDIGISKFHEMRWDLIELFWTMAVFLSLFTRD